jgi:hypothetical protein
MFCTLKIVKPFNLFNRRKKLNFLKVPSFNLFCIVRLLEIFNQIYSPKYCAAVTAKKRHHKVITGHKNFPLRSDRGVLGNTILRSFCLSIEITN